MSLTVNALLLDPQGQPLANLDAQVYMFALAGTLRLVGSGRSGVDGRLSIICNFTPVAGADYQPRIQLRLKRGTTFVEASENPQSENASVCDLGTVTFNPALIIINMSQITTIPLADLTVMRDQVSTLTQTKTTLESQVSAITAQKNTALSDLQRVQADVQARDSLIVQKDALIAQKGTDLANLQATRVAELKARDSLIAQKDALITQKANDLASLQNTHVAELKAKDTVLAQKDAVLQDVQARLDAIEKGEVPQIGLDRLAQTTADSLKTTQTRLQQDRSGFQLGKVSLQLKVMTGNDGGQVGLPRTSDIEKLGANALGQVLLDFHPPGQNVAAPSAAQIAVPPLAGYTEVLARRKLGETGLRVEVLSQLVRSDDQAGRVVLQNPAPGTAVTPDSTVMIAIGKKG